MSNLSGELLLVKVRCENVEKNFHEEGSGCIVPTDSGEYDYVLTALHCLIGKEKDIHEYGVDDIKLYNDELGKLEPLKTYENRELDIVVIVIKKMLIKKYFMVEQKCIEGSVYIPSFPVVYSEKNKFKTFNGKVASNKDSKLTIDINDYIYDRRNNVTECVRGVSGAGIFKNENQEIYLIGIITNVPINTNPFAQIEGVDISKFIKIIEDNSLHKISEIELDMISFLKKDGKLTDEILNVISTFLEKEFKADLYSRLEQGGQVTDERINLENVFIDLYATSSGTLPQDKDELTFINKIIKMGDCILRKNNDEVIDNKFVVIGGAGQGKSTLTQFLSQIYRAYYLKEVDKYFTCEEVERFIKCYCDVEILKPKCFRFPFRIILKDYAGWLAEQKREKKPSSILAYFKVRLENKGGGKVDIEIIRYLLRKMPFVFIFDGLDEVPITSNRIEVLEEINNFVDTDLRRENCDALIIATTRPQGYTEDFNPSKYKHLRITQFDKKSCMKYLNRLITSIESSEDKRVEYLNILSSAVEDDIISRLMKTPLQATILAILVRSGGHPPHNRYSLFNDYYITISKREQQKGIIPILNEYPDYIQDIHYKLGFTLQVLSEEKENPSSTVDIEYFKKFVQEYLSKDIELPENKVEKYTTEILEAITHRLVFISEIEDGRIGFNIRSMQEYFAANYYLYNELPEKIPDKLRRICCSSYWRNTFLFIIGHINKNQRYLIDTIDAICGELNGSIDSFGKLSGRKIAKIGSWLALDILHEDIFRGRPKDENRFINYLEDLFIVPYKAEHSIFGKLSDDIKNGGVIMLLEKYISKCRPKEQLTSWMIAAHMLSYGEKKVIEIMDKYWPNGENEVFLIKKFAQVGVCDNEWYIGKLVNALIKHDKFEFLYEVRDPKFINGLRKNNINSRCVKSVLIENLFILGLKNSYMQTKLWNDIVYITNGEVLSEEEEKKEEIFNFINVEIVNIFEGYNVYLKCIRKVDLEKIGILKRVCGYYSINCIQVLLEFISNPCIDNIKKLLLTLKQEPESVYEKFFEIRYSMNWVYNKLFTLYSSKAYIDDAISFLESGGLGDFTEWNAIEESIIDGDKFSYNILLELGIIGKSIKNIKLNNILSRYNEIYGSACINDKSIYYNNYLEIILYLLVEDSNEYNDIKEIFSNQEDVEKIIEACTYEKNSNLFYVDDIWIFILYFMSNKKIIELANNKHLNCKGDVLVESEMLFCTNKQYVSKVFAKVLKVILNSELETSLIQILPSCIFSNFQDIRKCVYPTLDINYLHEIQYENIKNEMSRIIICLFDVNINAQKQYRIINRIKEISKQHFEVFEYIIRIMEKCRMNEVWVENFLINVYDLAKNNENVDSDMLARYESCIRNVIESYSTELYNI